MHLQVQVIMNSRFFLELNKNKPIYPFTSLNMRIRQYTVDTLSSTIALILLGIHTILAISPILIAENQPWRYVCFILTLMPPLLFLYEAFNWTERQRRCIPGFNESNHNLRVCVIGAGPSGLCTTKELLEENLTVDCYEEREDIGGLFLFDKGIRPSVSDGCKLVSSPIATAFGDFPPEQIYRHWTAQEYVQYLKRYAIKFDLIRHIIFKSKITGLERNGTDKTKWKVYFVKDGLQQENIYDAVVIATGLNAVPKYPSNAKLISSFKGEVLHSASLKEPQQLHDKKICIVGSGESAADIAYRTSSNNNKVFVSFRSGSMIIPRINPHTDLPNDFDSCRLRFISPMWLSSALIYARRWFCHTFGLLDQGAKLRYALLQKSNVPALAKPPTKSNQLVDAVHGNNVKLKREISGAYENIVKFVDGTSETIDIIILTTGMTNCIHLLVPDIDPNLCFLRIFPLQYDNIAVVGHIRPHVGSIPTVSEVQARLIAQVFSGNIKLPDKKTMEEEIQADVEKSRIDFPFHNTVMIHWMRYFDRVAIEIGCKVRLQQLWRKPKLLWKMCVGTFLPAHTRIVGPHSCPEEAERTIMKVPTTMNLPELFLQLILLYTWWVVSKAAMRNPKLEYGII